MSCAVLATTGTPLAAILSVAVISLIGGIALLLLAGRRRDGAHHGTTVLIALLASGIVLGLGGTQSARAATNDCATRAGGSVAVTVEQTSVNTNLAPGAPASTIVGFVSNPSNEIVFVNSVTVSIADVTKASGAVGTCDSSDFVLQDVTMPVGQVVQAGGSAPFSGALISFNDKSVDQDACKGATVNLAYISD